MAPVNDEPEVSELPPGMKILGRTVYAGASPGRGSNGRLLCRWCHQEISEPRRRTWCSQVCVDQYAAAANPRELVAKRDQGVCAICGADTRKLDRVLRHAARSLGRDDGRVWRVQRDLVRWAGFVPERSLWDADHIVPVVEGGTMTLDNLRTLCVPCHRSETAALRKRLAQARRQAKAEALK